VKFSEIPLVEYIDIEEQCIDLYIHTKDKRMILIPDVQTDMFIDSFQVSVEHMMFDQRVSFVMMREDFSHLEYKVSDRQRLKTVKEEIDDLYSYLEDDESEDIDFFLDYHNTEVLKEP
jgi:hypothetical protein